MNCKFCRAQLDAQRSEHLPTDECGTYVFACGSTLHDGTWNQSGRCASQSIRLGVTVRRKLKNGQLSDRIGTVQGIYDGEQSALVRWKSTHARLAYRDVREQVEEISNLVVVNTEGADES